MNKILQSIKARLSLSFSGNPNVTMLFTTILVLGAALRLFQLGHDGFWNDEIHVALAAVQPTYAQAFDIFKSHPMPMPLDYTLAWLTGKISITEFALRLPAAMWGTFTIAVSYFLFRKLTSEKAALLGSSLLAVSPLHIHYSQELRFYAPLLFFYLLSTLLLWRAVETSTMYRWLLFLVITILGVLFHVFVVLALVHGFIWLGIKIFTRERNPQRNLYFFLSCLILGLVILIAYFILQKGKEYNLPLLLHNPNIFIEIGYGLGWFVLPYGSSPIVNPGVDFFTYFSPGKWIGLAFFVFWVVGTIYALSNPRRNLFGFALVPILQVIIIISIATIAKFPFVYRQVLFLFPGTCLLVATGSLQSANALHRRWFERKRSKTGRSQLNPILSQIGVVVILFGLTIPTLIDYYSWPKSNAPEVIDTIISQWEPDDKILVIPGYNDKIYRYYLSYVYQRNDIASAIIPIDIPSLKTTNFPGTVFLAYSPNSIDYDAEIQQITEAGYQPYLTTSIGRWLGKSLFIKK